jgi:hypothetical protein
VASARMSSSLDCPPQRIADRGPATSSQVRRIPDMPVQVWARVTNKSRSKARGAQSQRFPDRWCLQGPDGQLEAEREGLASRTGSIAPLCAATPKHALALAAPSISPFSLRPLGLNFRLSLSDVQCRSSGVLVRRCMFATVVCSLLGSWVMLWLSHDTSPYVRMACDDVV